MLALRLVIILLQAIIPAAMAQPAPAISIMHIGEFHGDEVIETTDGNWFGLYQADNTYRLLPVTVTVETVYDPLLDSLGTLTFTGKKVTAIPRSSLPPTGTNEPIVLVKGDQFTAGPLETAIITRSDTSSMFNFSPAWIANITLNSLIYNINLNLFNGECTLSVSYSLQEQIIAKTLKDTDLTIDPNELDNMRCHDGNGFAQILWAGDIDRDGKLDILLNPRSNENAAVTSLYLSSLATGNNLLKKAASFKSTGC